MSFGENLKRIRTNKGVSQRQLSEMLYVDRSSVARWELGTRVPDVIMINRISECLGVDAGELVEVSELNIDRPNVIIVDNERIVLSGALPILEEIMSGASITGFMKPSEALTYAKNNRTDIAFLDIELGHQSGLKLCDELLRINPSTNVIFITAYEDYSLDAWATGASGFILKPISVEAVRKQLGRLRYPVKGLNDD